MNRTFATLLSVVFHPLLMPTLLFYILLFHVPAVGLGMTVETRRTLLGLIFVTTYLIPGCSTYLLYRTGSIGSLTLNERKERRLPLLFTTVFYGLTSWLFYRELTFDALPYQVMLLLTVALLLTFFISFFWKISAHSVGIGGVIGMLMVLNSQLDDNALLYPILASIVTGGFVMSARLALQAHTLAEVAGGFLLGTSVGLCLSLLIL